jgi:uncharacterized membrane protein YgaE (UPF0421/DUF939 family)
VYHGVVGEVRDVVEVPTELRSDRPASMSWSDRAAEAIGRVRTSFWPAAQAALAATLAWLVAHRALGHAQPFFAPIAAAIALSTTHLKRSPRIVQMLIGVLLGIGVAEVLSALIGTSTLALGLIVLVTMLVAVLLGAGFVGMGTMVVNQSVASAILVLTVRGHGVDAERALDALVGGVVALVVGVILFPADPLPRLKQGERAVLRSLASAAEQVADLLRTGRGAQPGWALVIGHEIHEQLSILAQARTTARANARIAPRRWRLRPIIEAEDQRIARLNLLADATLSLVRAVTVALVDREPVAVPLQSQIATFAKVLEALADTPQPWPESVLREAVDTARDGLTRSTAEHVNRSPVVASSLRAGARGLLELVQAMPSECAGSDRDADDDACGGGD